jgi:hypothetical protein
VPPLFWHSLWFLVPTWPCHCSFFAQKPPVPFAHRIPARMLSGRVLRTSSMLFGLEFSSSGSASFLHSSVQPARSYFCRCFCFSFSPVRICLLLDIFPLQWLAYSSLFPLLVFRFHHCQQFPKPAVIRFTRSQSVGLLLQVSILASNAVKPIWLSDLVKIIAGGFSVLFLSRRIKNLSFLISHCTLMVIFSIRT